jgi:hypothetical protein
MSGRERERGGRERERGREGAASRVQRARVRERVRDHVSAIPLCKRLFSTGVAAVRVKRYDAEGE